MKKSLLFIMGIYVAAVAATYGGPYAPNAGIAGTTAISASDPLFVGWGTGVAELVRGPVDISVPAGAAASYGEGGFALGASDATPADPYQVVSLGDGGYITLTFANPISNGAGDDFAIFENSLTLSTDNMGFWELAFVEVSSNGMDYFRFDSISLTQTATQIDPFGNLDTTDINNLAGKYSAGYGTPFDLQEMAARSPLLNVNAVTHVRVRDVVGSIDPAYATYDASGNMINDPYKTDFSTGGFDLDAVGVIHAIPEPPALVFISASLLVLFCYNFSLRRNRLS